MRELNESELEAVSGGATTIEYAILLRQSATIDTEVEVSANQVLKTKHDTAKNSVGNIR